MCGRCASDEAAATLRDIEVGTFGRCILPWIPLMHGGGDVRTDEKSGSVSPISNRTADCDPYMRRLLWFSRNWPTVRARVETGFGGLEHASINGY